MDFRWVAFITMWALLTGPIFGPSTGPASPPRKASPAVVKPAKQVKSSPVLPSARP